MNTIHALEWYQRFRHPSCANCLQTSMFTHDSIDAALWVIEFISYATDGNSLITWHNLFYDFDSLISDFRCWTTDSKRIFSITFCSLELRRPFCNNPFRVKHLITARCSIYVIFATRTVISRNGYFLMKQISERVREGKVITGTRLL